MYKTDKIYLKKNWDISIEYHPTNTKRMIICIPGADGSVRGYKNKYLNLGNYIQEKNIASFVRVPNDRPQEFVNSAECVIQYCLDHSKEICGEEVCPEMWLMGFSAGGASVLLTAWEYPWVTRILVINPFLGNDVFRELETYLSLYMGKVFVVIGEDDKICDPNFTKSYIERNSERKRKPQIHIIPSCDHQLKGETNSKILSQLPEYYFLDKYKTEPFPDGNKGINLFDS